MSNFTQCKTVETRKEHNCLGCERTYPAGSQMDYVSGVWEGDFFGYYLCKPCDTLINDNHDLRDHLQDGFSSGAVKDYCEDEGIELPAMEG